MKSVDKIQFLNSIISLLPCYFSIDVMHFIASQFALESDFGSSAFVACRTNYCGMKVPSVRLTLCCNPFEKGQFASYYSLVDCVHDYLLWLSYFKFTRSEFVDLDKFATHLKLAGYCPDDDYIDRIYKIYNQFYSLNS